MNKIIIITNPFEGTDKEFIGYDMVGKVFDTNLSLDGDTTIRHNGEEFSLYEDIYHTDYRVVEIDSTDCKIGDYVYYNGYIVMVKGWIADELTSDVGVGVVNPRNVVSRTLPFGKIKKLVDIYDLQDLVGFLSEDERYVILGIDDKNIVYKDKVDDEIRGIDKSDTTHTFEYLRKLGFPVKYIFQGDKVIIRGEQQLVDTLRHYGLTLLRYTTDKQNWSIKTEKGAYVFFEIFCEENGIAYINTNY
jgi:hypothetical protein